MHLHCPFPPPPTLHHLQSRIVFPSSCRDPSPQGQGSRQAHATASTPAAQGIKQLHRVRRGFPEGACWCAHCTHVSMRIIHTSCNFTAIWLSSSQYMQEMTDLSLPPTISLWLYSSVWQQQSPSTLCRVLIPQGDGSTLIQQEGQDWMVMTARTHLAYGNVYIPDYTQICILITVC